VGKRQLRIERRRDSIPRRGERDEERVALGVDLGATVTRVCLADKPTVRGERIGVELPELMEERRRALDVREEQRHGANGRPRLLDQVESRVLVEDLALEPLESRAGAQVRAARR
jgi:hypothetical protein